MKSYLIFAFSKDKLLLWIRFFDDWPPQFMNVKKEGSITTVELLQHKNEKKKRITYLFNKLSEL